MPYRRTRTTKSRWMNLKYRGTCKVCGQTIEQGETAFYDAVSKTVTCHAIECCQADGLTKSEWRGSPISGSFVQTRTEQRFGSAYVPNNSN